MSTATTASSAAASSISSAKVRAFVVVFAITAPILYVACDLLGLPLFSYHPATNRVDFGYALPRRGEGPVMYWYGWTATVLIGCTLLGALATLLPERVTKRIPLFLVWLLPVLAVVPLVWSLMPFWTKG